jgi:hypothetical protein
MGLDMYLDGIKFHSTFGKDENGNTIKVERPKCKDGHDIKRSVIDFGYWRKHPDLHGYIVNTYADGVDECQEIELSANDLEDIACAIELDKLPHTEGFFFGTSEWHKDDKEKNADIFRKASRWLKSAEDGWTSTVIYQASW